MIDLSINEASGQLQDPDGKATKIIIPSEIQGIAGLVKAASEVMKD